MRKTLSGLIAVIYFSTTILFAHAAEISVWAERRPKNPPRPKPVQLAALPLSALQFPIQTQPLSPKSSNKLSGSRWPAPVQPYVQALPVSAGRIKNVHLPDQPRAPFLFIVQDVHLNQEAQINIAGVLSALNGVQGKVSKDFMPVVVEGAFEAFDFSTLRSKNFDVAQKLADHFLEKKRIAAPSYVGLTAKDLHVEFVGVDDAGHYKANVQAVRGAEKLKAGIRSALAEEREALEKNKRTIFNAELAKFDAVHSAYSSEETGFGDYVAALARLMKTESLDFEINQFLAAYEIERSIDFGQVERERNAVIQKLGAKISQQELSQLALGSLAYRSGQISFADYYRFIRSLIQKHGVPMTSAPAFDRYVQYVLLSDGIDADKLFDAVKRSERAVIQSLCKTGEERRLMAESRALTLKEKLINFSLTPDEWAEYKQVRDAKSVVRSENEFNSTGHAPRTTHLNLNSFEQFYLEADARSEIMAGNVVGLFEKKPESGVGAMVLGGFHTPLLTAALKKKGIGFAVVQPRVTKFDGGAGTEYLSVFTREKSRLDNLFKGEKLFLAPYELALGTRYGNFSDLWRALMAYFSEARTGRFKFRGENRTIVVEKSNEGEEQIAGLSSVNVSVESSLLILPATFQKFLKKKKITSEEFEKLVGEELKEFYRELGRYAARVEIPASLLPWKFLNDHPGWTWAQFWGVVAITAATWTPVSLAGAAHYIWFNGLNGWGVALIYFIGIAAGLFLNWLTHRAYNDRQVERRAYSEMLIVRNSPVTEDLVRAEFQKLLNALETAEKKYAEPFIPPSNKKRKPKAQEPQADTPTMENIKAYLRNAALQIRNEAESKVRVQAGILKRLLSSPSWKEFEISQDLFRFLLAQSNSEEPVLAETATHFVLNIPYISSNKALPVIASTLLFSFNRDLREKGQELAEACLQSKTQGLEMRRVLLVNLESPEPHFPKEFWSLIIGIGDTADGAQALMEESRFIGLVQHLSDEPAQKILKSLLKKKPNETKAKGILYQEAGRLNQIVLKPVEDFFLVRAIATAQGLLGSPEFSERFEREARIMAGGLDMLRAHSKINSNTEIRAVMESMNPDDWERWLTRGYEAPEHKTMERSFYEKILSIISDQDLIIYLEEDDRISFYDLTLKKKVGTSLIGNFSENTSIAVSPDGARAISATFEDGITHFVLWDLKKRTEIDRSHTDNNYGVVSLVFSPDSKWVAVGSENGRIWFLNSQTLVLENNPLNTGRKDPVTAIAFSPDGKLLLTATEGFVPILFDLEQRRIIRQISLPSFSHYWNHITSMFFAADGRSAILVEEDDIGVIPIDAVNLRPVYWSGAGGPGFVAIHFNPAGTKGYSFTNDGAVWRWRPAEEQTDQLVLPEIREEAIYALVKQGRFTETELRDPTKKEAQKAIGRYAAKAEIIPSLNPVRFLKRHPNWTRVQLWGVIAITAATWIPLIGAVAVGVVWFENIGWAGVFIINTVAVFAGLFLNFMTHRTFNDWAIERGINIGNVDTENLLSSLTLDQKKFLAAMGHIYDALQKPVLERGNYISEAAQFIAGERSLPDDMVRVLLDFTRFLSEGNLTLEQQKLAKWLEERSKTEVSLKPLVASHFNMYDRTSIIRQITDLARNDKFINFFSAHYRRVRPAMVDAMDTEESRPAMPAGYASDDIAVYQDLKASPDHPRGIEDFSITQVMPDGAIISVHLDGIGAHGHGDQAARFIGFVFYRIMKAHWDEHKNNPARLRDPRLIQAMFEKARIEAEKVFKKHLNNTDTGSTVIATLAVPQGDDYIVATRNIGDSRAYAAAEGLSLENITLDDYSDDDIVTEKKLRRATLADLKYRFRRSYKDDPYFLADPVLKKWFNTRNLLNSSVSGSGQSKGAFYIRRFPKKTVLFFLTDGATDPLTEAHLGRVFFSEARTLQEALPILTDAAQPESRSRAEGNHRFKIDDIWSKAIVLGKRPPPLQEKNEAIRKEVDLIVSRAIEKFEEGKSDEIIADLALASAVLDGFSQDQREHPWYGTTLRIIADFRASADVIRPYFIKGFFLSERSGGDKKVLGFVVDDGEIFPGELILAKVEKDKTILIRYKREDIIGRLGSLYYREPLPDDFHDFKNRVDFLNAELVYAKQNGVLDLTGINTFDELKARVKASLHKLYPGAIIAVGSEHWLIVDGGHPDSLIDPEEVVFYRLETDKMSIEAESVLMDRRWGALRHTPESVRHADIAYRKVREALKAVAEGSDAARFNAVDDLGWNEFPVVEGETGKPDIKDFSLTLMLTYRLVGLIFYLPGLNRFSDYVRLRTAEYLAFLIELPVTIADGLGVTISFVFSFILPVRLKKFLNNWFLHSHPVEMSSTGLFWIRVWTVAGLLIGLGLATAYWTYLAFNPHIDISWKIVSLIAAVVVAPGAFPHLKNNHDNPGLSLNALVPVHSLNVNQKRAADFLRKEIDNNEKMDEAVAAYQILMEDGRDVVAEENIQSMIGPSTGVNGYVEVLGEIGPGAGRLIRAKVRELARRNASPDFRAAFVLSGRDANPAFLRALNEEFNILNIRFVANSPLLRLDLKGVASVLGAENENDLKRLNVLVRRSAAFGLSDLTIASLESLEQSSLAAALFMALEGETGLAMRLRASEFRKLLTIERARQIAA